MPHAPSPHFRLDTLDGITVVRLVGPWLLPVVSGPLYGLVENEGHRRLLLDFADVRFLSSAALAILLGLKMRAEAAGGRLGVCRLDPALQELFRLTRLDEQFAILDDEREALSQF